MVMPDVQVIPNDTPDLWPKFSVQDAPSWHLTDWGIVALSSWIALLATGIWALLAVESLKRFRLVLGLPLAGQLALHLVYGNETFLYVLDFMPALVLAVDLASFTHLRRPVSQPPPSRHLPVQSITIPSS
jgi:hypothetical protein